MNYNNAKQQFEKYLDGYDSNNDKVRLKIIHTYGVVHAMEEICHRMQLSEEDTENLHVSSPFSMTLAVLNS